MKFDICVFLEHLSRKDKFDRNLTRITGTLHEDQYTSFLLYLAQFFLECKMSQKKSCTQNPKHILCSIIFLFFENHTVYEIMGEKKYVGAGQATDDDMAHAHCMLDN